MIRGEKVRFDIHKILYSIYKLNKNFKDPFIKRILDKHKKADISLINNVALNSMRYHFYVDKIINKYTSKRIKDHERILFISAITQIVFLNFREYAVINCSVEIAKKLKIYHGFVNACLKNISKDKKNLRKTKINYDDLPRWFKNETKSFTNYEKRNFIKNFTKEPDLHLVFKNKKSLDEFDDNLLKTSETSGFLSVKKDVTEIKSYFDGNWWVQDYSSFFPIYNLPIKCSNKKFLDVCAAPGGKAFQLLSRNFNVVLNDKSIKRIKLLKSNLKRLNYSTKILNEDFTKFKYNAKYDFIIIDAPCSSIGTIRKNPEIFFKNKKPNLSVLVEIQKKMLKKASIHLNKEGMILYMVCSFLKRETEDQINSFLKEKNNFRLHNFELNKNIKEQSKLIKNNVMFTLPDQIFNHNIDGFFAAFLKKIK